MLFGFFFFLISMVAVCGDFTFNLSSWILFASLKFFTGKNEKLKKSSQWPLFLLRSFLLIFTVGLWNFLLDGNVGYKHLCEWQIRIHSYTFSHIENGQVWVAWSNLWQKSKIYKYFRSSPSLIFFFLYLSTMLESWLSSWRLAAFGSSLKYKNKKSQTVCHFNIPVQFQQKRGNH